MKKILQKLFKSNSGFSITELMITTSIIGTMATISVSQFDDSISAARDASRMANTRQMQTALNLYNVDHGYFPKSNSNSATAEDWNKLAIILNDPGNMYISEIPADPLDTFEYQYKYWSDGKKFRIEFETEDPNDKSPRTAWGL